MRPSHFVLAGFCLMLAAITATANLGYARDFLGALTALPMGIGDKLGHAILFGILGLLANLATRHQFSWWITLLVACAATLDEFSQLYLPNRSFDLADLASGLVGIAAGSAIAAAIGRRSPDGGGEDREAASGS